MIIGIGHRKGMGKDTFAQMLLDELNDNLGDDVFYYKQSFADGVKGWAYDMFCRYGLKSGLYYEQHRDEKEVIIPELLKTPREIYLLMGQFGRSIRPDYWIEQTVTSEDQNLIIPDLRYPNEMERIKALGGVTIEILNPRVEITHDEADDALERHMFDYLLVNEGTLDELRAKANEVAVMIKDRSCA
jgi:hypothetical protein